MTGVDRAPRLTKPSFGHVETWIFDLDNTLYPHEANLWPQVDVRITLYLGALFGLDGMSARALQKYYFHRYGTTLNGLMREHGIDPVAYMTFAHDIDLAALAPDEALGEAIARLPGRKLILTNGSRAHADRVATQLGLRRHFEDVFDIADSGYVPKPEQAAYDLFLAKHRIRSGPRRHFRGQRPQPRGAARARHDDGAGPAQDGRSVPRGLRAGAGGGASHRLHDRRPGRFPPQQAWCGLSNSDARSDGKSTNKRPGKRPSLSFVGGLSYGPAKRQLMPPRTRKP